MLLSDSRCERLSARLIIDFDLLLTYFLISNFYFYFGEIVFNKLQMKSIS